MAFSDFDLGTAVDTFGLREERNADLFAGVAPLEPSEYLRDWLRDFGPLALAVSTELARSVYIIAPLLAEAQRRAAGPVHVFPGIALDADKARGLNGYCDYLVARSEQIYYLRSPLAAVVEAKREDIIGGLGQCAAAMVGMRDVQRAARHAVPGAVRRRQQREQLEVHAAGRRRADHRRAENTTWARRMRSSASWSRSWAVPNPAPRGGPPDRLIQSPHGPRIVSRAAASRLADGVARLPEATRPRHAAYLRSAQNADGGFPGREGGSDLYYTGFALRGLSVLDALTPDVCDKAAGFLRGSLTQSASVVDFFSLLYACLLVQASGGPDVLANAPADWPERTAALLETFRTADGGYTKNPGGASGSTYHTFLVGLCYQLLGKPLPDPAGIVGFVASRRREDGGFVEIAPMRAAARTRRRRRSACCS